MDRSDRTIAQGSKIETRVGSALMAEAMAMREALVQASERNLTGFTMVSDSQHLINLIKIGNFHLEIYGIAQDIIKLTKVLEASCVFISRSDNIKADAITKSAFNVCTNHNRFIVGLMKRN